MICKRSIHTHLVGVAAAFVLSSLAFAAQNPVPFIVQPLSPAAIAPGVPGFTFTLIVSGSNFVPRCHGELEWSSTIHVIHK
jgi:hypothetical protein